MRTTGAKKHFCFSKECTQCSALNLENDIEYNGNATLQFKFNFKHNVVCYVKSYIKTIGVNVSDLKNSCHAAYRECVHCTYM